MSGHVLRIEWHHATEFIPLSNSWIEVGASIATVEYWPDSQEIIMYIVGCTSYRREGPELTMNLGYLSSRNPMLREINGSWGGNKIIVNFETKIASAQWTDIRGAKHSGFGKSTLLDENVLDEFSYATLSEAPAPSQSALRAKLLREYKSCVLSGEVTHSALDVAHLIEAGTHGDYSIGNSILLRTDYRRLMDRGLLGFSRDGRVILSDAVRGEYRTQLEGKKLPSKVFMNIKSVLAVRYPATVPNYDA